MLRFSALVLTLFLASAQAQTGEVYDTVDTLPELVGGMQALMDAVVYPDSARRAGVEGRVFVQFVVGEDGAVRDVVAARSPDPALGAAAVRAVESTVWVAGAHEGKPAAVRFAVPIRFVLSDDGPPGATLSEDPASRDSVYLDVDVQPQLIGGLRALQRRVVYPVELRQSGVHGQVFVQFVVDETGVPTDFVVTRSAHPGLSEAAVDAVRGVRFSPGRHEGRLVKVQLTVPISFRLN